MREGMGGAFEASRAGGISCSQVQPRWSSVEAGKGGLRVGEQGPSCLARSEQVEIRGTGSQTGGQTQFHEAPAPGGNARVPSLSREPSLPASAPLGLPLVLCPQEQTRLARLTALEDGAVVRQATAALERRAVPALVAQLVLTLVDSDVQALKCGRCHVGAAQAQA